MIHQLSEELINKIAAGEVIERPSSVVKELVENALDAKATQITIDVENAGQDLIKISDNGMGMTEVDARKAILRHTTSKLHTADDLFSISTLGFRGEALASIAAVSQLRIVTKQKDVVEGFSLLVEGGRVTDSGVTATNSGTMIEVKNLFFNTPARKKFLKTNQVELRHIINVVTHYALINPHVSIKLVHNNNTLINSPSVTDLRDNIASLYGVEMAKDMLKIDFQNEFFRITGYVCKPYQVRNDKTQQAVFVNKRWVRNEDVMRGVYDAYHSLLFVNKHPVVVLHITTDPTMIDVNVHPNKLEIKFEQKEMVRKAVFEAVRQAFEENHLIPEVDVEFQQTVIAPVEKKEKKPIQESKYVFEPAAQMVFEKPQIPLADVKEKSEEKSSPVTHQKPVQVDATDKFPAMKLLGQVHKTFFIAETEGGAYFIDQHAVHERVLYEQFMEQMNSQVEVQHLLQGELLEFTLQEVSLIMEYSELIEQFGFTLESFGDNSFIIKTVPTLFGRLQPKELIYEVLSHLEKGRKTTDDIQETIITRMACRAAVMAGDTLTVNEMENYLSELSQRNLPYTCPHGRPTMFKVSVDELEKKFRRKGLRPE